MLNVFPKKSLYMVILLASTALTACGGGGGGDSSFTVTTDTKSGTLPQIRPFIADPAVPDLDASAAEYVDTPTLREMGLTPFYATGLSGSGISVGVLDSGIDGDHEELDGRELDMLSGLLAGKSDKEIAIKYGIALVTVKHYL